MSSPSSVGAAPASVTFLFESFDHGAVKARFNWITADMTIRKSVLQYAKKQGFTGVFTETVTGESAPIDLQHLYEKFTGPRKHEVQLTPIISHKAETGILDPDTEYVYCVGDGGEHVTDPANPPSFRTPPAKVDEFSFLWITDAQSSGIDVETVYGKYEQFLGRAVKTAYAESSNFAFILSTGDNVDYGFDTKLWDGYYNALQPYLYSTPYYTCIGNHEYEGNPNITGSWDSVEPYCITAKGRVNVPNNGPAYKGAGIDGLEPVATGAMKRRLHGSSYYFEYGDAIFIVLDYTDNTGNIDDTGDVGYSQSTDKAIQVQLAWMKSILKANDKTWRIVAMHQGPYMGRFGQPKYWKTVTDSFDACGIDLVISGHDHLYLRSKLMHNNEEATVPGTGTTYITGATAGYEFGTLYGRYNDVAETYTAQYIDWVVSGYHIIDVKPSGLSITAKGIKMLPKDGVSEQKEDTEGAFAEDNNGYRDLDVASTVVITTVPRQKSFN